MTFNSKVINSLLRHDFKLKVAEITNWVDLQRFSGMFFQKNCREYYRQSLRNKLLFVGVTTKVEIEEVYNLIVDNRTKFDRPIYMTLTDILETGKLWPVDFFKVKTSQGKDVASAILYRWHPDICFAVFWGDNETGRPLRAMDFLVFNLYTYYKKLGFKYIDLGISTESGSPNEGLLRFKESHEATSSLRYKFSWNALNC